MSQQATNIDVADVWGESVAQPGGKGMSTHPSLILGAHRDRQFEL